MLKSLREIPLISVCAVALVVFLGAEALNKIQLFYSGHEIAIQKVVKLAALVFFGGILLLKNYKAVVALGVFSVCFAIGQWFLPAGSFDKDVVISFSRYLFFLTTILFFTSSRRELSHSHRLEKMFKGLLVGNSLLIILAWIFEWAVFKTYGESRFGYDGLFMASSTAAYFYIIGFVFVLIKYPENWFAKWFVWLVVIAGILTGTKSVVLAFLLMAGAWFFLRLKTKKAKLVLLSGVLVLGAVAAAVFFTSPVFSEIITENGWLSAVLSNRDQLLMERTLPFVTEKWNAGNYFFGGLRHTWLRPQMALFDLVFYFGFTGTVLYLWLFFKSYFDFHYSAKFITACFVILFLTVFITGNFFYNANVPIYLVVLKYTIARRNEDQLVAKN